MCLRSEPVKNVLVFFLSFVIVKSTDILTSSSLADPAKHYHPKNAPLMCYDCNSEYDSRCYDPFDNTSMPIINCHEVKIEQHIAEFVGTPNVQPRVCRKIVQKIDNRTRILRGCGFLPDKYDDKNCAKRSGFHNLDVFYCACTTSLCNGAQRGMTVSFTNLGFITTFVSLYLVYWTTPFLK